tara:strand:+ start:315 stop:1007 length:693 start_codon:yes stop_codon:yes gene_type:complete
MENKTIKFLRDQIHNQLLEQETGDTRIVPRAQLKKDADAAKAKRQQVDFPVDKTYEIAPADLEQKQLQDVAQAAREKLGAPRGGDFAWASGIVGREVTPGKPLTPKEIKRLKEPLSMADIARLTNTIGAGLFGQKTIVSPGGEEAARETARMFKKEPRILANQAREEAKDEVAQTYGIERDFLEDPRWDEESRKTLKRAYKIAVNQIYKLKMANAAKLDEIVTEIINELT